MIFGENFLLLEKRKFMFIFSLVLQCACYQITKILSFEASAYQISTFGFYRNGTYHFTFRNNISRISVGGAQALVLTKSQYIRFLENFRDDVIDFDHCEYDDAYDKKFVNFSGTYDEIIYSGFVYDKEVYYTILMMCRFHQTPAKSQIFFDATYVNPNGQLLDYRYIPLLTIYPIFIALFGLVLIAFVGVSLYYKRHFLKIYLFIIGCCILYIIFLAFSLLSLHKSSTKEGRNVWDIALTVFECLYCICLFSFLVVSTTGWCILNVELSWKKMLFDISSVVLLFSMLFLQQSVTFGYFEILFFFLEILGLYLVAKALFFNTSDAERHINAHLYVIMKNGIKPQTTPIFEKFKMYHYFLYIVMFLFIFIFCSNIVMGFFDTDYWLESLINIICQFSAITSIIYIFRPRGPSIDIFMKSDNDVQKKNRKDRSNNASDYTHNVIDADEEFADRDEVMLDDLDGFDPRNASGADWNEGMELPLQPILVGEEVSRKPLKKNVASYTSIEEPLNQDPTPF